MTIRFQDNFSKLAEIYGSGRPAYPDELFATIAEAAPGRDLAWDAGTGSGQAAVHLTRYFKSVVATDASAAQIANSWPHPQVTYRVEPSERTIIAGRSVDVITSGQAAHWFDIDTFYAEARRVLKPGGAVALFCYGLESVSDEVNYVTEKLYVELLGPYWPKRTLADHTYQDIPFPFNELPRRVFRMHMQWTLPELLRGFRTWSASLKYQEANGEHPVDLLEPEFREAWGDPDQPRRISWPVYLRIGTVE